MTLLVVLIAGVVASLFLFMAVAPLEVLGWYAGWFGEGEARPTATPGAITGSMPNLPSAPALVTPEVTPNVTHDSATNYLIYLSGIGAITADSIPEEEKPFIAGLQETLPTTIVIGDIFPYSVTNLGLTGQRITARVWHAIERIRLKNPDAALAFFVNARNLVQMAISADRRYGPIYNLGVARELYEGLLRHGYRIGCGVPVTLLGWSGGAQIALGASWYLPSMIGSPVRVISIGGVMADDKGIEHIQHLWHMWGDKDHLSPLAEKLYAGRWKIFPTSVWNRALSAGKITLIPLGPIRHNGPGNYFDNRTKLANGETPMQHVLASINEALTGAELVPEQPAPAAYQ